jgi:carbon monoxide dehydrogenase subunit G
MRIEGQFLFEGVSCTALWDFLTNPDRIAQCLPGCQKLVKTGGDTYEMALSIGIGPVRGTFAGSIRLHDLNPISEYRMSVSGKGAPGFVNGEGRIALADTENGAQVHYSGDVSPGGAIAGVGQRVMGGAARMVIDQFFKCAAQRLASPEA